jgi:two-component system, OmpR family, sensor kinase
VNYWNSLRGRLSFVFLALFATIVLLGLASVWSLSNSNEVSKDVRDRWLPNTRLLGDLNNFTSDYRTAEADSLIASSPAELRQVLHDIQVLDQAVIRAQRGYESIPHDAREWQLYDEFSSTWDAYLKLANRVTALVSSGHPADAAALYRSRSRQTNDAAQDMLGELTDYNVVRAAQASERSVVAYQRARWLLGSALAMAGVLLAVVIARVRRSVSMPLLDLTRTMRQLAANDTGVHIDHTARSDEIGEMARAVVVFRGNAIDLMQSQRGLAQQATMLEEKLAHEQYVTQLQRNFVSMITHEFRTPLTQIDAQAQRLINLRTRLTCEDLEERARRIRAAVQRIVRLIDSLVDTARLVDGDARLFFHPEPIDLAAVLRDVCSVHRELSPCMQIFEDFGNQPLPTDGDPKLLFQVFSNLLSNAIKYSAPDVTVTLRARQTADQTVVSVEDHGIGIPEADQAHIFTRYYRGANVAGFVGTGVGLFLVATVVHLHGGEVTVESEEGNGSCFTVTLPHNWPASRGAKHVGVVVALRPDHATKNMSCDWSVQPTDGRTFRVTVEQHPSIGRSDGPTVL